MSTLFSGLNIALQSMLAQQQAIQSVEHNVANANTEGYHRQVVNMAASVSYGITSMIGSAGAGMIGTGVVVDKVNRMTVEFYDTRYRKETSQAQYWESQKTVLSQLEIQLDEAGSDGLIKKMDAFWSAWQTLSSDPTNSSYRTDLYDKTNSLAGAFNWRLESMNQTRLDLDHAVVQNVQEINVIADQLAKLNQEISRVKSTGDEPNDLMDKRDLLLDQLAGLTGVTSSVQEGGDVIVSLNGHTLVMGNKVNRLETYEDPGNPNLTSIRWDDGLSFIPTTGKIGGVLNARDGIIKDQMADLNTLAAELITRVNTLHTGGVDLNGDPGEVVFNGTNAFNISVNSNLSDPNKIAAADDVDMEGDGSVAVAIATLQTDLVMNGASASMNQYYNNMITNMGLVLNQATSSAKSRLAVVDAMDTQRESVGGVSLDEEATNLVKYQRAYEAAARILTALDEMLNTVINGMGLVGR